MDPSRTSEPAGRRLCVVTGSRADYGLLRPVMDRIAARPDCALRIIVTGMHLDPAFGETWRVVAEDGFAIAAKVDLGLSGDTPLAVARAVGRGVSGLAEALAGEAPDLVLALGDRFEIFAAAQAAMMLGIPLAHVHGGEVTEGAMDEMMRHAISKMAALHFTSARIHSDRLIRMGEPPERVFTVGAPGLDGLRSVKRLDRDALAKDLGLDLSVRPLFVVTYHPATRGEDPAQGIRGLIDALEAFPSARVIATGVNADAGHRVIDATWRAFAARHPQRVRLVQNLGQVRYVSLLGQADAVIGNSSSGIIEAPSIPVGTVNIGVRQKGRLRPDSVIDCPAGDREAIVAAIRKALEPEFRAGLELRANPYDQGGAAERIAETLAVVDLAGLTVKPFHEDREGN